MKQYTLLFHFAFIIILTLTACRKNVPQGQLIQANGFVIDPVINKKLPDVKVYLYGGHSSFYGVYYDVGPLDSTITDNNGNFSIKYTAEGNSVDYALTVSNLINGGYSNQSNYVNDLSHTLYIFNYSRQLNNVAIIARLLYYARVNLKVLSNPYDTLYLDVISIDGSLFIRKEIIGTSVDTTFLTRYLPDARNIFEYNILSVGLEDSSTGFLRRMPDTLQSILKDTVVIAKTINSTYDIPLRQY